MDIKVTITHAKQVSDDCSVDSTGAYQYDKLVEWLKELLVLRAQVDSALHESNPARYILREDSNHSSCIG